MLKRLAMVISETTVRPMTALWRPCHRGIRESIHIRWGGRASKDDGMDTSCEVGVIYAILNLHVQ